MPKQRAHSVPWGKNTSPLNSEDLRLIAQFRREPLSRVRKRRVPKNMPALVERALADLSVGREETPEQAILREWKQIIGSERAERCTPARITGDGTLIVLAPNPVLRQELSFQKRLILSRIRNLPACRHIRKILLRGG